MSKVTDEYSRPERQNIHYGETGAPDDYSNKLENIPNNSASLKSIGNFIKESRISRNQSIEELASSLKIGAHQLQALEEGNEDLLPEKVFIKAMVRRI